MHTDIISSPLDPSRRRPLGEGMVFRPGPLPDSVAKPWIAEGAPSPTEIRLACWRIQDEWDEETERDRRFGGDKPEPFALVPIATPGKPTRLPLSSEGGDPVNDEKFGREGEESGTAKLTDRLVKEILAQKPTRCKTEVSIRLAKEHGVTKSAIQAIWNRRTWRHITREVEECKR